MSDERRAYRALAAEDAERATIGALVMNPGALGWVDLRTAHFSLPLHQHTFEAMRGLWDEDRAIDEITILDALEREIPNVSLSEISKLITTTATGDNIEHWAAILEEHRRKRVLHSVASSANTELLAGKASSEVFDQMIESLTEISSETKAVSETMEEVGHRVEEVLRRAWEGGETSRLPSGIVDLDKEIGGFPVGVPTAIGARPGVGKSLTLWNIVHAACLRGENVVVLTNEDNADRTYKVGLAYYSGVERRRLESSSLSPLERARITQAFADTAEANSRYHTVPIHGKKMIEVCRIARAMCRRYSPTILALDYIQNVPNPEPGMTRNYGIEENLTHWDALVAEENVVGILMGQLKRLEPGAIPTMSDFKDSGSIEQKAKCMLTLSDLPTRNEGYQFSTEPNFSIGVVKNSEGLSDFAVDCIVDKGLGKFK